MPVVIHDAKGKKFGARSSHRLLQDSFERLKIRVALEDRKSSVRTVQNVIDQSSIGGSFGASHPQTIPMSGPIVNKRYLTPLFCARKWMYLGSPGFREESFHPCVWSGTPCG